MHLKHNLEPHFLGVSCYWHDTDYVFPVVTDSKPVNISLDVLTTNIHTNETAGTFIIASTGCQ